MRFFRFNTLALLLLSLLLTGCNSFLVSEEDVNLEVAKRLEQKQQNNVLLTLEGGNTLNLNLLVTEANIDFTERDGGLVLVDLVSDLEGTLTAFGQSFTLTTVVKPSFQSGVRIEEDRLYLVAPQITKIEVQGSSFGDQMLRSTLGSLHGDLEKSLVEYFDIHPIYVLDHSPFEKAAASLVKGITIREESLELSVF
jgi:hypothetical protein